MKFRHTHVTDSIFPDLYYDTNEWVSGNYKVVQYNKSLDSPQRVPVRFSVSFAAYVKKPTDKCWGVHVDQPEYSNLTDAQNACEAHNGH